MPAQGRLLTPQQVQVLTAYVQNLSAGKPGGVKVAAQAAGKP
jgi:hypothetical protein